ncbi:MAG: OmpA family protein, partial [Halofilum sp. (in: g-proteobacteria)]
REETYVTLGCAGDLVLAFTDNAVIDVAGPDLYVFEIGGDTEPTGLAISPDGEQWIRVGRISGGKAEVDIAPYTQGDTSYRYVRLVDLKRACDGRTPGADIDAVGALGSATRISLDSAVLFASGEYELRDRAHEAIDQVVERVRDRNDPRITVTGHTDSVGGESDNLALSRRRARAVADYLIAGAGFEASAVSIEAHGERRPIASNSTAEGRQRNRRVELTVRTTRANAADDAVVTEILGLWETRNHGILEFRREDGIVSGDYTSDGGTMIGSFTSPTVFEGFWVENNSNRTCDTRKDGREHWGPIRLEFDSPDRDRFAGAWGYCGDEATNETWRGERLL